MFESNVVVAAVVVCATILFLMIRRATEGESAVQCPAGRVVQIVVYPVKSCGGISVASAALNAQSGLEHDRKWMVVDARGAFVSQRRAPRLALVSPTLQEVIGSAQPALTLRAPGMKPLSPGLVRAPQMLARVWDDSVAVVDQGDAAAKWFERAIGMVGVRLVWMPDDAVRQVEREFAPRGASAAFSDGFPVLLAAASSLAELNKRIVRRNGGDSKRCVPMDRFRPNVVVSGHAAFAEDTWGAVKVGAVRFAVSKPCSRCKMPTIDQATAKVDGWRRADGDDDDDLGGGPGPEAEPTVTLQTFRTGAHLGLRESWKEDVFFGQNLCLITQPPATLNVGDLVEPTTKNHASCTVS